MKKRNTSQSMTDKIKVYHASEVGKDRLTIPPWFRWFLNLVTLKTTIRDEGTPPQDSKSLRMVINNISVPRQYPSKVIALIVFLCWGIVMVMATVYRIASDDGTYTQYYTNWVFMMGTVTYLFFLVAILDPTGFLLFYFYYGWWWVYFANAALVFWLVNFVLFETPQLVTDEGEKHGYGVVLVVERTIHVFPYVFALIFLALLKPDFKAVMRSFPWVPGHRRQFVLYLAVIYLLCHLPFTFYLMHYDASSIYNVKLPVWLGFLAVQFVIAVHVLVAICALSPFLRRFTSNLYTVDTSKGYNHLKQVSDIM